MRSNAAATQHTWKRWLSKEWEEVHQKIVMKLQIQVQSQETYILAFSEVINLWDFFIPRDKYTFFMTNEFFKWAAGCNGIENYFVLHIRLLFHWEKEH